MWKKIVQKGEIPKGRSSSSLVFNQGKLYLFGGENIPRVPVDEELHSFDLKESKWTIEKTKGDLPLKRLAHSMVSVGKNLYLYGGRLQNENDDLKDLFSYNTETKEWKSLTTKGDSPFSRSYHAMTSSGSYIYLFGGCQHNKEGTMRKNDLHILNVDTLEWKELKPKNDPPSIRGGPTITSCGKYLFVHGGFSGKELDDFYSFDTEELVWTKLEPKGTIPEARSVHGLYKLDEKHLFVFGGEKEPSKKGHEGAGLYFSDGFIYDIEKNEWKKVEGEGPSARGWFQGTSIDKENVIIFGGFTGEDRVDDMWLLSFS